MLVESLADSPARENVKVKLKLLMPFLQATLFFKSELDILYPGSASSFLKGLSFAKLNLLSLFNVGCNVGQMTQLVKLLVMTLAPLGLVLLLSGTVAYSWLRRKATLSNSKRRAIGKSLSVAYFVYMPVTLEVFRSLSCDSVGLGAPYLRADYSIRCDSRDFTYASLRAFATLCLVGADGCLVFFPRCCP